MKNLSRGFTLIEVLVVVLIIGILTSVALPQYRKAVVKTRVMKLLPLIRAIDSAEQVYYSTYMQYTGKFADLDISMPGGGSVNTEGTRIDYSDFVCYMSGNAGRTELSVYCNSKDSSAPRIEKYFTRDYFFCWYNSGSVQEKICASIAEGKNKGSTYYTFR